MQALMEDDMHPEKRRPAGAMKAAVLVFGVLAFGAVMALTGPNRPNECGCLLPNAATGDDFHPTRPQPVLPRLLDLGATTCVPCKMMGPVLDELKKECEGRLDVQFVDVWKTPGAADQYGIRLIPTQIFFDASGRELYRHEGFFAKEDILGKWDELGVHLTK